MADFLLIVMTHSFFGKYIKVNKMSQLRGKYVVNGRAAVLGETPEDGLRVNKTGYPGSEGRVWASGGHGWGRSLRPPPGGVWSFKDRMAGVLAGSNYVWEQTVCNVEGIQSTGKIPSGRIKQVFFEEANIKTGPIPAIIECSPRAFFF